MGSGDIFFLPTFQTQLSVRTLSEIVLLSILCKAPSFPFPLGPKVPLPSSGVSLLHRQQILGGAQERDLSTHPPIQLELIWGQSDSTMDGVLALHFANLGSIPRILLSPLEMIPQHSQMWPQTKTKQTNKHNNKNKLN